MVARVGIVLLLSVVLAVGCIHSKANLPIIAHQVAPYQQFVAQNFDWSSVQRVVVMPLANQTAYPKVADELLANLAAELQRAGRFDIVVATRDDPGARAQEVFNSGQFNEVELLRIAREYQAQAVLFGKITQYHPYAPPRIGISLLLVSPGEGVAISSTDGLWDARESNTVAQAQNYLKQSQNWPRSLVGADRVLQSPDVFQRFVCQQIAVSLYPPTTGATGAAMTTTEMMPELQPILDCPPASGGPP